MCSVIDGRVDSCGAGEGRPLHWNGQYGIVQYYTLKQRTA